MAVTREHGGGRLKGFRLSDIPIELRVRAARQVARSIGAADTSNTKPEDRLFASLLTLRDHGPLADADAWVGIAKHPSERVYWVRQKAWDRLFG